jgi:hypothetical protein
MFRHGLECLQAMHVQKSTVEIPSRSRFNVTINQLDRHQRSDRGLVTKHKWMMRDTSASSQTLARMFLND